MTLFFPTQFEILTDAREREIRASLTRMASLNAQPRAALRTVPLACAAPSDAELRAATDSPHVKAARERQRLQEARRADAPVPAAPPTPPASDRLLQQAIREQQFAEIFNKSPSARAAYGDAASMSAALNRRPALHHFTADQFTKGTC